MELATINIKVSLTNPTNEEINDAIAKLSKAKETLTKLQASGIANNCIETPIGNFYSEDDYIFSNFSEEDLRDPEKVSNVLLDDWGFSENGRLSLLSAASCMNHGDRYNMSLPFCLNYIVKIVEKYPEVLEGLRTCTDDKVYLIECTDGTVRISESTIHELTMKTMGTVLGEYSGPEGMREILNGLKSVISEAEEEAKDREVEFAKSLHPLAEA